MNINELQTYLEENEVDDEALSNLGVRNVKSKKSAKQSKRQVIRVDQTDIHLQHEAELELLESGFDFSYTPAQHEASWLFSSIGPFYQDQWFHDILRLAKGGKEASVYLCAANPQVGVPYLAAKVYRPRKFRNLRKDYIYREGRDVLDGEGHILTDGGALHAIQKKTAFGKKMMHASWIDYEVKTLECLNQAGGDVPKIFANGHMAILMEFIGDAIGSAPTLHEVDLTFHEARELFERIIFNIELMLRNQIIHGDLSAYNILYWEGRIVLIDFPQAISPVQNPNAYPIFCRDVQRVCDYFAKQGLDCDGKRLAKKLWQSYRYPETASVPTWMMKQEDKEEKLAD